MTKKRITFFLDALHGGGAEKAVVKMLQGLTKKDFTLDLVLAKLEGPYLEMVPKEVNIIDLGTGRAMKSIWPLAKYLQQHRPWAFVANMGHVNVAAALAKELSGISTKMVLVEQNNISAHPVTLPRAKLIKPLAKWLYPRAEVVAGVSAGVARDVEYQYGLAPGRAQVINNPVVDETLFIKAQATPDHPWFQDAEIPVFMAVGRLTRQKDFPNLLQAFALVRAKRAARLIILGEGEDRSQLEAEASRLGITADISMPGFAANPYSYMSNAAALVLSSQEEGLPTVLIEALGCGCRIVSTDCPSGPDEILDGGKYGTLVPVANSSALAAAMLQVLDSNISKEVLIERAQYFSTDKVVDKFLDLLHSLEEKI
jgi:glycosyltransferase involved in cell wall biosynthesis